MRRKDRPYYDSNTVDTLMILRSLENQREWERISQQGGIACLHNPATSCTGFLNANPNDQVGYAMMNGLYPDSGSLPE